MARRHAARPGDLESIFGRLQELVLANSGEDEFEEIFKLLVAKLISEHPAYALPPFKTESTVEATAQNFKALLAKAHEQWPGVLQGEPCSRLTPEHLTICIEALQNYSLMDSRLEVLDAAFEYLVSRSAKGSKGQFFTPRHVIDCCVKMIDPQPGETIVDPACGSAGFLVHAMAHIRDSVPELDVSTYCRDHLWGFDFDARAVRVAKALMVIAGDGNANLYRLNSLLPRAAMKDLFSSQDGGEEEPHVSIEDIVRARTRSFKGFDIVLTNPPFAGEVREPHILRSYELSRRGKRMERDILFLERCVNLLRPGGRLAIVLPHNKVGASGFEYARRWLMRNVQVVAVLGLGRNTFLPHTHQKASVVFGIKRDRPLRDVPNEDIAFFVSERDGKDTKGHIINKSGSAPEDPAWLRADHDLNEAAQEFQSFISRSQVKWSKQDVSD